MSTVVPDPDPLAEATGGLHHWNDPGMDDFESGYEPFTVGVRVKVLTEKGWVKGTVREDMYSTDRGIDVECDEVIHDNLSYYGGRGASVLVLHNTRRGILSRIQLLDELETTS